MWTVEMEAPGKLQSSGTNTEFKCGFDVIMSSPSGDMQIYHVAV